MPEALKPGLQKALPHGATAPVAVQGMMMPPLAIPRIIPKAGGGVEQESEAGGGQSGPNAPKRAKQSPQGGKSSLGKGKKDVLAKAMPPSSGSGSGSGGPRGSVARPMKPAEPRDPPPQHLLLRASATQSKAAVAVKEEPQGDAPTVQDVKPLEEQPEEKSSATASAAGSAAAPSGSQDHAPGSPGHPEAAADDGSEAEPNFACDGCLKLEGVVAELLERVQALEEAEAERNSRPWRLGGRSSASGD